jgi:hypothetical protein
MEAVIEFPTMVLKESIGFADHRLQWASREEAEARETLKFVGFLEDGETDIGGVPMRCRAKALGNPAGWIHAERLLAQDQRARQEHIPEDAIPVELQERILVFAGMPRYQPGKFITVAYLYWDKSNQKWAIDFFWLGYHFNQKCLLVLLAPHAITFQPRSESK